MEQSLSRYIEALIFIATEPVSRKEIKKVLSAALDIEIDKESFERALQGLIEKYQSEEYSFQIVEISEGFQFLTKGAFHRVVETYLKQTNEKRLSRAALETLSIIAYKQPVVKSEIERIRGVNCDYTVQKLLEKELIEISGRSDGPGKPLIYSTSEKFMDYFGLRSIKDLPKIREFEAREEEIGEIAAIEESFKEEE